MKNTTRFLGILAFMAFFTVSTLNLSAAEEYKKNWWQFWKTSPAKHHYKMGVQCQDEGNFDDAISNYMMALQKDPDEGLKSDIYKCMGDAYKAKGDTENAKKYQEMAQVPADGKAESLYEKAMKTFDDLKEKNLISSDPEKAKTALSGVVTSLEEVLELNPTYQAAKTNLSAAKNLYSGVVAKLDEAKKLYQSAMETYAKITADSNNLLKTDPTKAKELLNSVVNQLGEVLNLNPKDAGAKSTLDSAKELLSSALEGLKGSSEMPMTTPKL